MKLVSGSALLAFLVFCLVGCCPDSKIEELTVVIQPDAASLTAAYGAPFNLRVDIVGVQAGDGRYKDNNVDKWFRPGDPLRNPKEVVALTFEPEQGKDYKEQTFSPANYPEQWKTWMGIGATHLVIFANIPVKGARDPNTPGDPKDIRRFSLPLQCKAWKDAKWAPRPKNTVLIKIDGGGMQAVPPPADIK